MRMKQQQQLSSLKKLTIISVAVAALLLFSHTAGYSQTSSGSQNLSSVFKNLLKPRKDVSGHYSNPQFGIADIVFPVGWHVNG
jgi:hypothetical protein